MSGAFRVTHRSIGIRTLQGLQHNLDAMGRLQQQLSSGKLISRPSDSPTGSVAALRLRSEIRNNEQYVRNAQDGLGWLGTADEALSGSLDLQRRVRDLTLQGMSAGAGASSSARTAIAAEVRTLREGLIDLANSRYLDRPVFGGTTTATTAYTAAGTWQGDTNAVLRTVGADGQVRVDVDGEAVFGTGATNLFAIIDDIADHVVSNPGGLDADLGRLDAAMGVVQKTLADVGSRYSRIESMRQTAEDRLLNLKNTLSETEDIDLPKTIVELQMQEMAYQAALGATSRVVQPSLVEFLR
jgi:flagellar hook-associated protein 3 FlgL